MMGFVSVAQALSASAALRNWPPKAPDIAMPGRFHIGRFAAKSPGARPFPPTLAKPINVSRLLEAVGKVFEAR